MRMRGELCDSAKKGRVCIDDICRGADVTLCGFDKEFYESCIAEDDDPDFDNVDEELEFDCAMGPDGQCGAAGSEDCDFECPVMAAIHRQEVLRRKKKVRG